MDEEKAKEEVQESEKEKSRNDKEKEEEKIDVSPFEIEDEFIECIYYLSDSTILVVTRG